MSDELLVMSGLVPAHSSLINKCIFYKFCIFAKIKEKNFDDPFKVG